MALLNRLVGGAGYGRKLVGCEGDQVAMEKNVGIDSESLLPRPAPLFYSSSTSARIPEHLLEARDVLVDTLGGLACLACGFLRSEGRQAESSSVSCDMGKPN
jgi:hypothetical protein